ncbi:MAG: LuxR C-terminal-related transcriptional regulator [Flammeovirgaceae bacterium]
MSAKNWTVIHASAFPIRRYGAAAILRKLPLFDFLEQEIEKGDQALLAAFRQHPDIILVDYQLPNMSGLEIAECLLENQSFTKVALLLEDHDVAELSDVKLKQLGINVLCYSHADAAEFHTCLKTIKQGERYVSPHFQHLLKKLVGEQAPKSLQDRFAHAALDKLSVRERTVMKLIAGGKSSNEIARKLCISNRTVDAHRFKICKKLNLQGRNALVHYAYEFKDVWTVL